MCVKILVVKGNIIILSHHVTSNSNGCSHVIACCYGNCTSTDISNCSSNQTDRGQQLYNSYIKHV